MDTTLALGMSDGWVIVLDAETFAVMWSTQACSILSRVTVKMSADGTLIATVGSGLFEECTIFNAMNGEVKRTIVHETTQTMGMHDLVVFGVSGVAFSPNGEKLVTQNVDSSVIVSDTATGDDKIYMQGQYGVPNGVTFNADGTRVLSCVNGWIQIFDAMTGAFVQQIMVENYFATSVSTSPVANDMVAITNERDEEIYICDIEEGLVIRNIGINGDYTMFAAFSTCGQTIATQGIWTSEVKLVDVVTGDVKMRLIGHTRQVLMASWCPYDANKIVSVSDDGTCKVWDVSTGGLLISINVNRGIESVTWGCNWVAASLAFAMGHHPRLGVESRVLALDFGVIRIIQDFL
jgi:WD40 repeat protein